MRLFAWTTELCGRDDVGAHEIDCGCYADVGDFSVYRSTRGASGAACPFPYHTAGGRCAGGEGEELDGVWEGPEGGAG